MAAGAGDNAAAAIGTGTVGPGKCNISLGTSGTVFITSDTFRVDEANALHSFAHADGKFHLMGCMLSAASCNKWWVEEILKTKDFGGEQENIKKLGENKVYFLPYLMGERSPHNDPKARGAFIGMTLDTTRTELTQAVLEGVAFALKDSVSIAEQQGITLTETTICGGGAKSELWKKMIANIMNLKVHTVAVEEGPAYGAAILAAVADRRFASVEDAVCKVVKTEHTIEPEADLVSKYEKRYQQFHKLYPALKEVYAKMQ